MQTVAIIIPSYNAARFIGPTIESALGQNFPASRIVVVDDGSSDGTADIAERYDGVHVVRQKNAGDAAARNTGFQAVDADFLIFLDHDDVLHPGAVEAHLRAFDNGTDMVFGSNALIDIDGTSVGHNRQETRRFSGRDVALGTTPSFSQCMYRRSAIERIGGFRGAAGSAADHDLNLRLLGFEARGFCHGADVMSYRLHGGQQTKSPARLFDAQMAVLEQHLSPGGVMDDPDLLVAARRHWSRYYGQFLLQEVVRATSRGRRGEAWRAMGIYFRGLPWTLAGTLGFLTRQLRRRNAAPA